MIPDTLGADYIAKRWPFLYHMAEEGSWEGIKRFGLRSTSALLNLYGIEGPQREAIEAARRPESVMIDHPDYGPAWIRDNKPINETVLRRTLVGMTEAEWYRTLNGRVFFWLTEQRLDRLRKAPPYRDRRHDILVVSTERVLARFEDVVELSPLNSGAVHPGANYTRGVGTFARISEYPWRERCRVSPNEPIVELTVPYLVDDLTSVIVEVRTY